MYSTHLILIHLIRIKIFCEDYTSKPKAICGITWHDSFTVKSV